MMSQLQFFRRLVQTRGSGIRLLACQANLIMGIRVATGAETSALGAFSQDILKIEMSGPEVSAAWLA